MFLMSGDFTNSEQEKLVREGLIRENKSDC